MTSGATAGEEMGQTTPKRETHINSLQFGVPATSLLIFSIALRLSDTPKSVNLTFPFLVVRILAAFKSQ
jgi:hypothetical protein